jgi:hypothetical protein
MSKHVQLQPIAQFIRDCFQKKWFRRSAIALLCILTWWFWLTWHIMFPKDPKERIPITLMSGGTVLYEFAIPRGYLISPKEKEAKTRIGIEVLYPSGEPHPAGGAFYPNWIQIELGSAHTTKKPAEWLWLQWYERKDRTDNGVNFDRYIGKKDGYDIFEDTPRPPMRFFHRTLLFKDRNQQWVQSSYNMANDGKDAKSSRIHAIMFNDISVQYTVSQHLGFIDPRTLHQWVEKFLSTTLPISSTSFSSTSALKD